MMSLKLQLEDSHKDLHQWFLFYQECILLGYDETAYDALSVFYQFLSFHLSFENEFLLSADNPTLRWPTAVYRKEHEKLLLKLGQLQKHTQHFSSMQGRAKRLALLDLVEHQQRFYHLLEHHEEREEGDLFLHLPVGLDEKCWLSGYEALKQQHNAFKIQLDNLLSEPECLK